ncbi:MAG: hypothetical protein ABSE77_18770, partial [Acidimicrobiales bacterium]
AHVVGGVVQPAGVPGRGEEEPHQREVESQGKGEDLMGVELAAPVPFVGAFDGSADDQLIPQGVDHVIPHPVLGVMVR